MRSVHLLLENQLLELCRFLVPVDQRAEWLRSWQAELWFERRRRRHDLSLGLLRDALWLRTDRLRQALSGTALLCLLLLSVFVSVAALPLLVLTHDVDHFAGLTVHLLPRYAIASSLTLLVSSATSFAGTPGISSIASRDWFCARAFYVAKVTLLLLLSALVSSDVCLPLEINSSFAAMPLELLFFVTMALVGLRWSALDSSQRCKHCLRSLAPPRRIGRPSWNFLEYNGTELACRDGHGFLSVPELETSWCRSSAWISQQL